MESADRNKERIKELTADFWNTANMAAFDKYYADDFVVHMADGDKSRDEYKALCQAYFAAFPDLQITADGYLAEGDRVTKIWTAHCTHKGEFMGIPASGNAMEVRGIEVYRLAHGQVVELWVSMDVLGMMQQMGAIPQTA
jgi:steroid delta-isomerase-like uncharacterized protein